MKPILKHILLLAFAAGLIGTACENNDIDVNAGTFPQTGGIGLSMGILQSDNYARESPLIDMDHATVTDGLHIKFTEPALQAGNYTAKIDESKVLDFNTKHGTSYPLYPKNFVTLENDGKITVEKGKLQSNSVSITFTYDESIEDSVIYLLPLTVEETTHSSSLSEERNTLYYIVNVWGIAPAEYDAKEKNFIQIAGVDPEFTNPLLLNKLYLEATAFDPIIYFNPFDIINLQFATVKADENELPTLYLKDDLAYVLAKREKYIVPLQQLNHKVCLTIKGGGEGIGFSNLGEKQVTIFINRIKQTIESYHLDGVNLYDANFSYKNYDNNFDYSNNLCTFVSSLRAALGDKIITYTQTAESPEGITDNNNSLKLGELVDYAWTDKLNTVIDPWNNSDAWTEPIAGITKEKWGALNSDIHLTNDERSTLTRAASPTGSIRQAGINHVFVINRVEYTTVGLESSAALYMSWGAKCNLREQYRTVGIGSPNNNQHLSIHNPLMPKDY